MSLQVFGDHLSCPAASAAAAAAELVQEHPRDECGVSSLAQLHIQLLTLVITMIVKVACGSRS